MELNFGFFYCNDNWTSSAKLAVVRSKFLTLFPVRQWPFSISDIQWTQFPQCVFWGCSNKAKKCGTCLAGNSIMFHGLGCLNLIAVWQSQLTLARFDLPLEKGPRWCGSGGRLVCRRGLASRRPERTMADAYDSETFQRGGWVQVFYPPGGTPRLYGRQDARPPSAVSLLRRTGRYGKVTECANVNMNCHSVGAVRRFRAIRLRQAPARQAGSTLQQIRTLLASWPACALPSHAHYCPSMNA